MECKYGDHAVGEGCPGTGDQILGTMIYKQPRQPSADKETMASYGYRLFRVYLTEPYGSTELEFDDPRFGKDGARGVLANAVEEVRKATGQIDDRASTYLRVDSGSAERWVVLVRASGGAFGEIREVVDTATHQQRTGLALDDAVLRDMLLLLVIPPYGTSGVLVAETRGRSHLTAGLIKQLNIKLKPKKLTIRLEANPADEVAWNKFLDQSDVEVSAIELIQNVPSSDRTRFGKKKIVTKASLVLKLTDDQKAKKGIVKGLFTNEGVVGV